MDSRRTYCLPIITKLIYPVENALKTGLILRGFKWAAILELYGHNGTISEALKNRTQTQLKGKARNLKLSFLKRGDPVPFLLDDVPGSLRAGYRKAQALESVRSLPQPAYHPTSHSESSSASPHASNSSYNPHFLVRVSTSG
jgi:protein TBF1